MKKFTLLCDHCKDPKELTQEEFFGEGGSEAVDGKLTCGECRKALGKDKPEAGTR